MAKRHEIQYSRRLDPVMRAVDNVRLEKDLSVTELCADAMASATAWMGTDQKRLLADVPVAKVDATIGVYYAGNGYLTESRRFESVPGTNRPCELVACDKHGRGGWLKAERNQPI